MDRINRIYRIKGVNLESLSAPMLRLFVKNRNGQD